MRKLNFRLLQIFITRESTFLYKKTLNTQLVNVYLMIGFKSLFCLYYLSYSESIILVKVYFV